MLRLLAALAVAAFLLPAWAEDQPSGNLTVSEVREVLERSKDLTRALKDLVKEPDREAQQAAREALKAFEGRQKEVEAYREQMLGSLAGTTAKEVQKTHLPDAGSPSSLGKGQAVVVFVSCSVPLETLRSYARDVEELGDPQVWMVMRGFVGGAKTFRPTLEFVWKVLSEDPDCGVLQEGCRIRDASIHIDPVLFQDLGIEAVPAVAFVRGLDPFGLTCESEGKLEAWVLYGDVSLAYALEVLGREAKSEALARMAERLRNRGFYGEAQSKGGHE